MPKVVMQPRCVHCLREQYVLAILVVSHGYGGCVWCGHIPPVFTDEEQYKQALTKRRSELDAGAKP